MNSNYLYIFATSRAIRLKKEEFIDSNSLLPQMATIADFEAKATTLGKKALINSLLRSIYLKEAADFKEFGNLKSNLNLVKFYTQADDFFRFFEEVNAEGVSINELYIADSYAEFERDLSVLEKLLKNYKDILDKNSLTDRVFIPGEAKINRAYIESFDGFVLELEGYLTKFELNLFLEISKIKPFIIKLRTTAYNQKIVKSFLELGIKLEQNSYIEFNLSTKEITDTKYTPIEINSEVIETGERLEQIAIAFAKIEEFVQSGISPDKIALIVPDESIVSTIEAYDKLNNLNFAMGRAYRNHSSYIYLEQLYSAIRGDELAKEFLFINGISIDNLEQNRANVDEFFNKLKEINLPLYREGEFEDVLDKLNLLKSYFEFNKIYSNYRFSLKEWLFLWLQNINKHTLDDTRGGKVTVIGILESRSVSFDGVVVIDFNEGIVPSISNKDRFLNSAVRAYAKLPTKDDRENLQKYYYARVLERAKKSALIYVQSSTLQPSKFLYELGLDSKITRYKTPLNILYPNKSNYLPNSYKDDIEVAFSAKNYVWSATMLKSFLECKRKFYYRYIKGLQEPPSKEINEGRVLHNILAKVITPNSNYKSKDELKKAFLVELGKIEGSIEYFYKKPLWVEMLEPFFEAQIEHFKQGYKVLACEFDVAGEINGLKFKGRVDRLDKKGDFSLLIDYKSGSTKSANIKDTQKLNDFQMSIYAKLLNKPLNSIDFAFIEILNNSKLIYLEEFENKDKKLIEHIEYLKNIDSFEASRCENLQNCRYCAYQLLCHRGEYL